MSDAAAPTQEPAKPDGGFLGSYGARELIIAVAILTTGGMFGGGVGTRLAADPAESVAAATKLQASIDSLRSDNQAMREQVIIMATRFEESAKREAKREESQERRDEAQACRPGQQEGQGHQAAAAGVGEINHGDRATRKEW